MIPIVGPARPAPRIWDIWSACFRSSKPREVDLCCSWIASSLDPAVSPLKQPVDFPILPDRLNWSLCTLAPGPSVQVRQPSIAFYDYICRRKSINLAFLRAVAEVWSERWWYYLEIPICSCLGEVGGLPHTLSILSCYLFTTEGAPTP